MISGCTIHHDHFYVIRQLLDDASEGLSEELRAIDGRNADGKKRATVVLLDRLPDHGELQRRKWSSAALAGGSSHAGKMR